MTFSGDGFTTVFGYSNAESTRTAITCKLKPEPVFNLPINDVTITFGGETIGWNNSLTTRNGTVTFKSNNAETVEVDTNGILTIKNIGISTITVSVAEGAGSFTQPTFDTVTGTLTYGWNTERHGYSRI